MRKRRRILPALNLRSKCFIALGCYIFGVISMTYIAQKDLLTAGEKLEALEFAYQLNTIILESRRHEKNFLLYGTEDALQENQKQIQQALDVIEKFSTIAIKFKVHPMLVELGRDLRTYQERVLMLQEHYLNGDQNAVTSLVEELRQDGQAMHELSRRLVGFEHKQIRSILTELENQMVIWSVVAILVGIFIPLLMLFKVFKPLKVIKRATEDIAQGQFSPIDVINTQDEMEQVIEAFNTMVDELQHRQDQLVQSQKLSSIGTLSAGIAHQLNNPLNNISTSCQIAISDFESGDRDLLMRMLSNIEQETARARDVVHGLLEFAREKPFALRKVNLNDTVHRAVLLVRSQVPASIQILVDIPPDLHLPMDFQRMQEVFLNLIINASQAITGEGTISISAQIVEDGDAVQVTIQDSGCGIPKEDLARLFDPFFTTKEEGKGTGLGLSIAYGIIQKHNGTIIVCSEPGVGTTFAITLPLSSDDVLQ